MKHRMLAAAVAAAAVISYVFALPGAPEAGQEGLHHGHAAHNGKNPLIEEMMILDGVFREVVSAVSLGDGARVHKALESMHGTMEKTHAGVHEGTVKVPKNSERLADFVRMDKEFHADLETLAHAAHSGDQKEMLTLTKKLLDGCVSCHRSFRGQ